MGLNVRRAGILSSCEKSNLNGLFTTGLKIKLCFQTKQRLKTVQEKNERTLRVMLYFYTPDVVNRKFKLF